MKVKELRLAKKLSQAALADMIKVERSTVAKWEAGGMPNASKLVELAAALDVTVDELLSNSTAPKGTGQSCSA